MNNKNEINAIIKYYLKAILIALIPIIVIMYFVQRAIKSEVLIWLITFALVCLTFVIAFILKGKFEKKDKKDKNDKIDFDPYAD